jgi:hypothetical protein
MNTERIAGATNRSIDQSQHIGQSSDGRRAVQETRVAQETRLVHNAADHTRLTAAAGRLVAEAAADPLGKLTSSVYESGRLVSLAPWLAGHQARRDFLRRSQRAELGWGGPGGYALVPTLSATAGLLAELGRAVEPALRDRLLQAATGGLAALHRLLITDSPAGIPDTVSSELVVPALVDEVNRLVATTPALPERLVGPLRVPAGFDPALLEQARAWCVAGELPAAMAYCLETLGTSAAGARGVRPVLGGVGCSPAATAAWVGGPAGPRESLDYLDAVQARDGGPVPVATSVSYFEAAWVLNSLGSAGLDPAAPAAVTTLLDRLEGGLASEGVPTGPGLPADSDDTGATLSALLRHGRVRRPESLLTFQADGYFRCFSTERNPSVSANAHVLEALALYLARRPGDRRRYGPPAATAAGWLLAQQQPDGSWWDKWHASPYYATACTVTALALHGGRDPARAIARAVAWVLATQRPDGSWGRWLGSVEETSYAVQILAQVALDGGRASEAVRRAGAFLADPPLSAVDHPIWHGKDLYTPVRVVQAAWLAARQLASALHRPGTGQP